jgi:class 3 adenylate cyclase
MLAMHRRFKQLLPNARGISEFVIAAFMDIRGFSRFSMEVESPETAEYVKRVYLATIDNYFPDATFFKPTGDGLMIIIPFTEASLRTVANETVSRSLRFVRDFPGLVAGDPMINFETPQRAGFGLSRGAACRLLSGRQTLDYSGRVLNSAARLTNLARPAGVVFDASFGQELLEPELALSFASDTVFLRGIAEDTPIAIHYSADLTEIPASAHQPLTDENWQTQEISHQLSHLRTVRGIAPPRTTFEFAGPPTDPTRIRVEVVADNPREQGRFLSWPWTDFTYGDGGGEHEVSIQVARIPEVVAPYGVRGADARITVRCRYPLR